MSRMYTAGAEGMLNGEFVWMRDPVRVVLVDGLLYQPSYDSDAVLASIPKAARLSISDRLTGKRANKGVVDADDAICSMLLKPAHMIVLFKDTGDPNTSTLICALTEGPNLPIEPTGGRVTVIWDDGPDRIFNLAA